MERKLKRVERWIGRCREACRMKRWQMALLEIESAKADLEGVRRDLWERAEAEETGENLFLSSAGMLFRRGGMAFFLLILMAVPLSVGERPRLLAEFREEKSLVFVTKDEKELLSSLRKSLSAGAVRFSEADFSDPKKEPERSFSFTGGAGESFSPPRKENLPQDVSRGLGFDEVLALVQVGERALRGTAIEVVTE